MDEATIRLKALIDAAEALCWLCREQLTDSRLEKLSGFWVHKDQTGKRPWPIHHCLATVVWDLIEAEKGEDKRGVGCES